MDFATMSMTKLAEFLLGRKLPGTGLPVPEEIVTKLRENYIDGATLLMLMEDIPNTAHRIQLRRISMDAKASVSEDGSGVEEIHSLNSTPHAVPESPSRPPLTPTPETSNLTNDRPITEKPCQTSTPKMKGESVDEKASPGLPHDLPIPDRFSIRVEEAIDKDDILSARLQLVKDVGNFYYGLCNHPKQGDYGRMAKKMCDRFPKLKDANADHYWVTMQRQLSMFFRNQRGLSKKTKGKKNTPDNQPSSSAKKIKLDDVFTSKRNLDLLKKTKKSDFSRGTFDTLMEETFKRRREFIQHEANSVNEILQQCPFLCDPDEIKKELVRLIGSEKAVGAPKRIASNLQAVLKVCGELSSEQVLSAIAEVQRRTKKKTLPGKLISFHDLSAPPAKMCQSKLVEFQIVCLGTAKEVKQVFISGENNIIYECPSKCLVDALFNLISCYYVFDVNYPSDFEGVLFFLQDLGLLCLEGNSFRYSKYNVFLSELKDFQDKSISS